jgi:hypothetical protein
MSIADSYYKSIWPSNLWLPKAIAIHESSEDPFAIGDVGDAVGLFQMHWSFLETWALDGCKADTFPAWRRYEIHHSPGIWRLALGNFLSHQRGVGASISTAVNIFHYGHFEPTDPAGYVQAVQKCASGQWLSW